MPIQRYKPEQIVTMLRQIEVGVANGKTTRKSAGRLNSSGAMNSIRMVSALLGMGFSNWKFHAPTTVSVQQLDHSFHLERLGPEGNHVTGDFCTRWNEREDIRPEMPKEPYRLYRCIPTAGTFRGEFFTCARPGRSREPLVKSVPDDWVDAWVKGLPGAESIVIVSLLGWKANGQSEFSFYSFRGSGEETERPDRPTFQQWLDARYEKGRYRVIEFPTTDTKIVASEILNRVGTTILSLLHSGETVVLMDSGGFSRTGAVCRFMGFVRQERTPNMQR